jgi:hypothetical protein
MTKAKTQAATIRVETADMLESTAFGLLKLAQDVAFKQGGISAVLTVGAGVLKEVDERAQECEAEGMDRRTTRATVASYLIDDYLPNLTEAISNVEPEER